MSESNIWKQKRKKRMSELSASLYRRGSLGQDGMPATGVWRWLGHRLGVAGPLPFLWAPRHSLYSSLPFREAGRKARPRRQHSRAVLTTRWEDVEEDEPAGSKQLCVDPRHHASRIHLLQKLSPTQVDWGTAIHTKRIFNNIFFPHGSLCWPIKEKKKPSVPITHILENLS